MSTQKTSAQLRVMINAEKVALNDKHVQENKALNDRFRDMALELIKIEYDKCTWRGATESGRFLIGNMIYGNASEYCVTVHMLEEGLAFESNLGRRVPMAELITIGAFQGTANLFKILSAIEAFNGKDVSEIKKTGAGNKKGSR